MNEEALVQAFTIALEQSQASFGISDVLLLVSAQIAGIGIFLFLFWKSVLNPKSKMSVGIKDPKIADEAHKLILTKDVRGVHVFLRIPEYFEKITRYIDRMDGHFTKQNDILKNLYNHQSEKIDDIAKKVE